MDRGEMRLAVTRALVGEDKVTGELIHLSEAPHDFTFAEIAKIARNANNLIVMLQKQLQDLN